MTNGVTCWKIQSYLDMFSLRFDGLPIVQQLGNLDRPCAEFRVRVGLIH